MSDTSITEQQQHQLDHIEAAEAPDGSVADFARSLMFDAEIAVSVAADADALWPAIAEECHSRFRAGRDIDAGFIVRREPAAAERCEARISRPTCIRSCRHPDKHRDSAVMIRSSGDIKINLYGHPLNMKMRSTAWTPGPGRDGP